MPENNVNDPITDQEIAFVHLLFTGTMTDRQAAEAVRLNPDTAADIKSRPCVSAYMLEHRVIVKQQTDAEELRFNQSRDRVLARLWQIADLPPEMTRNGMSAQVKAISMIIAIEGLIPSRSNNRHAVAIPGEPAPEPATPPFYVSAWMRNQQNGQSVDSQPSASQEEAASVPRSAPGRADDPPAAELSSSQPVVEGPAVPATLDALQTPPSQTTSPMPRVPMADYFAPDTRRPFSIDKNRFGRRR
jgi:hypothetical protein